MRQAIIIILIFFLVGMGCSSNQSPKKVKKKKMSLNYPLKAAASKKNAQPAKAKAKDVTVYTPVATDKTIILKPVKKTVSSKRTPKNALLELLSSSLGKKFYHDAQLLSLKIEKGLATANFSKEILIGGGAENEVAAIYAIVNTLTEFKEIKKVSINVEGKAEGLVDGRLVESFWGHYGLYEQPFARNEKILANN